jgi:hypothetical protein
LWLEDVRVSRLGNSDGEDLDYQLADAGQRHRRATRDLFNGNDELPPAELGPHLENKMMSRSDLQNDLEKLTNDVTQMADENDRLRESKAQMLAALRQALPILQDCLPGTADPDRTKEVIANAQNAIADGESDSAVM